MIYAINDGVVPEPTERGYVLRQIIRRAIRFCSKLSTSNALRTNIVNDVIELLGLHDASIINNKINILSVVKSEE